MSVGETSPLPQGESPGRRRRLLALTLSFTRAVRNVAGVHSIAFLGSLAGAKPHPKDADVLVRITDETDLAAVARHARRLQGKAQSMSAGADVFLATPDDRYLGRTCRWRDCGPQFRVSCATRQCGVTPYLMDDLEIITMESTLLHAPPVELWPRVVVRGHVPTDVEGLLLAPLRQEELTLGRRW